MQPFSIDTALYTEDSVFFWNEEDSVRLAGTLSLPVGEGPWPGVIMVSGSGPQDRDEELLGLRPFKELAAELNSRGIAVLRYDDRGVAASTGTHETATVQQLMADAQAAMEYLEGQPNIDASRTGVVGHSEGALIAQVMAGQPNTLLDFAVLLAGPTLPGHELIKLQTQRMLEANNTAELTINTQVAMQEAIFPMLLSHSQNIDSIKTAAMEAVDSILLAIPEEQRKTVGALKFQTFMALNVMTGPWYRSFMRLDPKPYLEQTTIPLLAIIGTLDVQVPHEENFAVLRQALTTAGNEDYTLTAAPGLNHLYQKANTGAITEYMLLPKVFDPTTRQQVGKWVQAHTQQ